MSSPGFNTGAGSSEYFTGRSTNTTINNLITTPSTTNLHHHHHPSLYRTQQLPPIFLDPSSQIPQQQQHHFIGKRTLAEFQTHQNQTYNNLNINNNLNNNNNNVLSNLLLRSVKPRTSNTINNFQFQNNSPLSFSNNFHELQQNPLSFNNINNYQTQRLGVPLLHHNQIINPNFHYRTSNLGQVMNPNLNMNRVHIQNQNQTIEPVKKTNDHKILEELEKQLLEDNDESEEADAASVITSSEWSESFQNLIGPGPGLGTGQAQTQVSSSPNSSTTSSTSSSAASPASICSKQTLIEAASAISEGKNDVALEILNRLVQNYSNFGSNGNSDQRLTNSMIYALKSRMNSVQNPSPVVELFNREHADSTQLLLENSVCFNVCFMAANLAILEAAFEDNGNGIGNGKGFCVVDFEIGQGKQYVNLLHALKARDGSSSFAMKIVAVTAENGGDENVKAVGEMLNRQAEKLRIAFNFRVVTVSQRGINELTRESLGCDSEETVIVNFAFNLNRIPDESVSTENPRDELLRRVKKLSPRVVVIVEQEMNCNTAPFLARVAESWSYYSALYDSVESVLGKDNSDRVKIEEGLSRKLCNSVACEGRDRVERFEVFGKWRARMSMAGFKLKPMSQNVAESIKSRLAMSNNNRVNSGLSVKEENGGICFGWMGRTLTVASAWR